MLVLTHKVGSSVKVGEATIHIKSVNGNSVKLGYEAPERIEIVRDNAIVREKK